MTKLKIELTNKGESQITHLPSQHAIGTSTPIEYGGSGSGFSSTDLIAAGLGSCIATTIQPLAQRDGLEAKDIQVLVTKELSMAPKKIESIEVVIDIDKPLTEKQIQKYLSASRSCPVHRSLNEDVKISISITCPHKVLQRKPTSETSEFCVKRVKL